MTLMVSTPKLAQEIIVTMTGSVTAPSSTRGYRSVVTMLEAKMNVDIFCPPNLNLHRLPASVMLFTVRGAVIS